MTSSAAVIKLGLLQLCMLQFHLWVTEHMLSSWLGASDTAMTSMQIFFFAHILLGHHCFTGTTPFYSVALVSVIFVWLWKKKIKYEYRKIKIPSIFLSSHAMPQISAAWNPLVRLNILHTTVVIWITCFWNNIKLLDGKHKIYMKLTKEIFGLYKTKG